MHSNKKINFVLKFSSNLCCDAASVDTHVCQEEKFFHWKNPMVVAQNTKKLDRDTHTTFSSNGTTGGDQYVEFVEYTKKSDVKFLHSRSRGL